MRRMAMFVAGAAGLIFPAASTAAIPYLGAHWYRVGGTVVRPAITTYLNIDNTGKTLNQQTMWNSGLSNIQLGFRQAGNETLRSLRGSRLLAVPHARLDCRVGVAGGRRLRSSVPPVT